MTQYWANFARTGNPNGSGLPNWPQYDLSDGAYMQFDTPVSTGTHFRDAECAFWNPFISTYVSMPTWAATGNQDDIVSRIIQLGANCGMPWINLPDCSTVGYAGSPDGR
jgi:hypothetical protein